LRENDELNLFDYQGNTYSSRIIAANKNEIHFIINEKWKRKSAPSIRIILGQCIIKNPKMDLIMQKCVECGVNVILPLYSIRSENHGFNSNFLDNRHLRWDKIAYEACKQCHRFDLPKVLKSRPLREFLNIINDDLRFNTSFLDEITCLSDETDKENLKICRLILSTEKSSEPIYKVLEEFFKANLKNQTLNDNPNLDHLIDLSNIFLLTGPEGGFEENEEHLAVEKGFKRVSISRNILRSETASILSVGLVLQEYERFIDSRK
jgi:16S rRNA (uracil1498-N3)-methyltransferase